MIEVGWLSGLAHQATQEGDLTMQQVLLATNHPTKYLKITEPVDVSKLHTIRE